MLLGAPFARASETLAYYEATWASIPAATLVMKLETDGTRYHDTLHVETVGLPRWLLHLRANVEASGELEPDGKARPANYNMDYDLRRWRNQHVRMKFVLRDGALVAERALDDSSNKPPLPEKYRRDIVDPVSAFAVIRERLRNHPIALGEHYVIPVFDDVRRFDIHVTVDHTDPIAKLVHVHLDLVPIAGFKSKKDAKGDSEDAARPIDITFRNDATMFPVRLEVAIGWLPLVIRFDHYCTDATHCSSARPPK